ncbi:MAG: MBL fold metallo-hydrolase, partial [Clostridiales bacterium]|nr:MBL fold metallo-hydrolase [Clostridiales bacterium]
MMDERCYLVLDGGNAVIIDPDSVEDAAKAELARRGTQLELILLTHGHFDHIGSVEALHQATGARIAIHTDDAAMLTDARRNLSGYFGSPTTQCPADLLLRDGDLIPFSGCSIRVIH